MCIRVRYNYLGVVDIVMLQSVTKKPNIGSGRGLRFMSCPHCGKKGYYKIPRLYERCRYCGINRMLLPGQDF